MNSAAETDAGGADGGNSAAVPSVVVVERVVTVEYLEPSMSRGLLGKFPDPSAFGFDYSQSSIWSPLGKLPRASPPSEGSTDFLIAKSKRRARAGSRLKNAAGGRSRWRRWRLRRDGSFLDLHEMNRAKLDFSPPSPLPAKEGWRRVLKAAIRKLKARQRRSRPAPLLQQQQFTHPSGSGMLRSASEQQFLRSPGVPRGPRSVSLQDFAQE